MSIMTILKDFNRIELAALIFYIVSGIIFLVYLALTSAPQLALLGIVSIISGYGVLTQRRWTPWLLIVLFVAATTFSLYTLAIVGFSNALFGVSLIVYAILTWVLTGYLLLRKNMLTF